VIDESAVILSTNDKKNDESSVLCKSILKRSSICIPTREGF
jgi:hypothetical protein